MWQRCCQPNDSALHSFTLTFRDGKTEEEFLRRGVDGARQFLFRISIVVLWICILILLLFGPWKWAEWERDFHDHEDYPGSRFDKVIILSSVAAYQCITMVFLRFIRRFDKIPVLALEIYAVIYSMAGVCVVMITAPHYMARARGYRSTSEDNCDRDTDLLLNLALVGMFVCLNPHTRWHMTLPAQVMVVCAYLVPGLVFGQHGWGRVAVYAAELAVLVIIGSIGKRMLQLEKRQNFLHLLQEKTKRVTSEFHLSQLKESMTSVPEDTRSTHESLPASLPTTTDTGLVFRVSQDLDDGQLDGIRAVGKREQWLLNAEDLSWNRQQILGVGGFGIVVQGQYQGIDVAVKVPKTAPTGTGNASALLDLCNELQILRRLRHPNIVTFFGAWLDGMSLDLALVLEFVEGETLKSYVTSSPRTSLEKSQIISQVSCALVYLHTRSPSVAHGDLKGSNIYVSTKSDTGESQAKLLDFGLARRITRRAPPMGGSWLWMAPEVLRRSGPLLASDVFSFGRVAHFVVTGRVTGEGTSRNTLVRDLKAGVVQQLDWPREQLARAYQDIVDSCNQADPASRPGMPEVHQAMLAVWESCGAPAEIARSPMDPDIQKELRALRRAAHNWRARQQRLPNRPESNQVQRAEPRNSLRSTPEDGDCATEEDSSRLYPGREITPQTTQATLLMSALVRTNFVKDAMACCEFHAALNNLQATIHYLDQKRCKALGIPAVGQCTECAAVLTHDDCSIGSTSIEGALEEVECDVCGEVIQIARPVLNN